MEYLGLSERILHLNHENDYGSLREFLRQQDLEIDNDIEYCIALCNGDNIVATGCLGGRIIKCVAVDRQYQSWGLANKLISMLITEAYRRGRSHLFIYTKPANYKQFQEIGFYNVAEVKEKVALLENDAQGLAKFLSELKKKTVKGNRISALVVNCNPFTLGHQYLVEKAATQSDALHIFVVWENRSSFPSEIRYRLVCAGTKHLPNIQVHKGKDYIISDATFPSYFLKDYSSIVEVHARLDLTIFKTYIAPVLNINKRFVGEEPYCEVTKAYNNIMKQELPEAGIQVCEIPRLSVGEEAISASKVRNLIGEGKIDQIAQLVPASTMQFILSQEAEPIVASLKIKHSRHCLYP